MVLYVFVSMYTYVYGDVGTCAYIYVYVCVCTCGGVCMLCYVFVSSVYGDMSVLWMHVHMCVYVCVWSVCTCVYEDISACAHIYA